MQGKEKLVIKFEDWDYTCGDGCCYEWGTKIYINGTQVANYNGGVAQQVFVDILEHLGYEIEIDY